MRQSFLINPQCLLLSSAARRRGDVGEIINLVSADTQKLMDFVVYFNSLWVTPIEITLCFYFLWQVKKDKMAAGGFRCLRTILSLCFFDWTLFDSD